MRLTTILAMMILVACGGGSAASTTQSWPAEVTAVRLPEGATNVSERIDLMLCKDGKVTSTMVTGESAGGYVEVQCGEQSIDFMLTRKDAGKLGIMSISARLKDKSTPTLSLGGWSGASGCALLDKAYVDYKRALPAGEKAMEWQPATPLFDDATGKIGRADGHAASFELNKPLCGLLALSLKYTTP